MGPRYFGEEIYFDSFVFFPQLPFYQSYDDPVGLEHILLPDVHEVLEFILRFSSSISFRGLHELGDISFYDRIIFYQFTFIPESVAIGFYRKTGSSVPQAWFRSIIPMRHFFNNYCQVCAAADDCRSYLYCLLFVYFDFIDKKPGQTSQMAFFLTMANTARNIQTILTTAE